VVPGDHGSAPCRNMTTPYSADDAKRSSQALEMSASRHPQNVVWAMFRHTLPPTQENMASTRPAQGHWHRPAVALAPPGK
jgi:hypothetical protein